MKLAPEQTTTPAAIPPAQAIQARMSSLIGELTYSCYRYNRQLSPA